VKAHKRAPAKRASVGKSAPNKPLPIIVITPGDPHGIGPEITWKALRRFYKKKASVVLLCVGAKEPFQKLKVPIIECDPLVSLEPPKRKGPFVWLWASPEQAPPGKLLEGFQCGWAIEKATYLVKTGDAAAIATGPISKDRLQKGGYLYPGHTEFLADLCQVPFVTMMLANDILRVTLVTTHLSLKDVPAAVTRERIRRTIHQTAEGLTQFWGIAKPRIGVAALNPHAGEKGLFGREELEVIEPEIKKLNEESAGKFELTGPTPADTLFANHVLASPKDRFDAVVCMYHDQGLIPVKLLDFHRTVNVTLGLPIIRTSVDHGVGFDIAGKGIADPSSLCSAIELATHFVQKRQRSKK
jgi:4-hydroxythreonine-4-phosphate dehydrogenase